MLKKSASPDIQTFAWKGKNQKGEILQGEISGHNATLIKLELRRQGILPIKVTKKTTSFFSQERKGITPSDICIFFRQLSTMLVAGIPLVQSLDIVCKGLTNQSMQKLLTSVRVDLESGHSLAVSLNKHPEYFGGLAYNIISAGEQSGTLDIMLARLATYKEKMESLKGKIKKALFYPAIVIIVAVIVSAALLIFVVPQFETVFHSAGAQLPLLTVFVMHISNWLQSYWWLMLGLGVGASYGMQIALRKSNTFATGIDRLLLKFPIIGPILTKSIIARFTRTLATTIAAGMPLVEALSVIAKSSGSRVYNHAIAKICENVATGQQLHLSLSQANLFPSMVTQMVAVGEESGALELMLGKVADFYEEQVDNDVDSLSSLIEPIIVVVLGVIVGTIVVAMYLPIFNLGKAL